MINKNLLAKAAKPSIAAARQDKLNSMQMVVPKTKHHTPAGLPPENKVGETDVAKAKRMLQSAAPAAMQTIIDIAGGGETDRERLAASRDILDRNAIGKVAEGNGMTTIPVAFLSACLVGIAALAGQDMKEFGDMSTLNADLEAMKLAEAPLEEKDE